MAAPTIIEQTSYVVTQEEAVRLAGDTTIMANEIVVDGLLASVGMVQDGGLDRGADLCLIAHRVMVGSTGRIVTEAGSGHDLLHHEGPGEARGLDGGRGGDLIVVASSHTTQTDPLFEVLPGGQMITGAGGAGQPVLVTPASAAAPSCAGVPSLPYVGIGGNGGPSGNIVIIRFAFEAGIDLGCLKQKSPEAPL